MTATEQKSPSSSSEPIDVALWKLRLPLTPPVQTPRGPVTETCLLLCLASDGAGHRGAGYSSFRQSADLDRAAAVAQSLLAASLLGLASLLDIERRQEATCADAAASRAAANALSLAAWDLAAQQRGVACADLWGRLPGRAHLDCYASALWLDQTPAQLIAEAQMHRANNYRYVKMRVSRSLEENLERIDAVRTVYSEPHTIALETGSEWDEAIANAFLDRCNVPLLWVEDPETHARMHLVREHAFNPIAAGEKCTRTSELLDLHARGSVRKVIIDVQYVGGPIRFLEAARALTALGATVGGHRFSHYSVHLLACLPRSLPIEMLDWTNPVFRPLAAPDASGRLHVEGPGFAVALDASMLERHGVKMTS